MKEKKKRNHILSYSRWSPTSVNIASAGSFFWNCIVHLVGRCPAVSECGRNERQPSGRRGWCPDGRPRCILDIRWGSVPKRLEHIRRRWYSASWRRWVNHWWLRIRMMEDRGKWLGITGKKLAHSNFAWKYYLHNGKCTGDSTWILIFNKWEGLFTHLWLKLTQVIHNILRPGHW